MKYEVQTTFQFHLQKYINKFNYQFFFTNFHKKTSCLLYITLNTFNVGLTFLADKPLVKK
jgi:hypothetical protein